MSVFKSCHVTCAVAQAAAAAAAAAQWRRLAENVVIMVHNILVT